MDSIAAFLRELEKLKRVERTAQSGPRFAQDILALGEEHEAQVTPESRWVRMAVPKGWLRDA